MATPNKSARRKAAPVSAHPLFPAIVALWFAALFGLGSLAIRPTLLEAVVLGSHFDALVPAAAPPLGVTARILLALILAIAGGLSGAAIAKRIARPKEPVRERKRSSAASGNEVRLRGRDTHPDAPARRPISAHEEIGGSQIEPAAPASLLPGRRRALAIHDEGQPAEFHDHAPLPGGTFEPDVTDAAPDLFELGEMDLGNFAEVTEVPARQEFIPVTPEAIELAASPLATTRQEFVVVPSVQPAREEPAAHPAPCAAEQIAHAPLAELGLVALTERFARSLQQRREAAAAVPVASQPAAPEAIDASLATDVLPAEPLSDLDAPTLPMALPAGMRPLSFDEPEGEEDDYSRFLPLRQISMPAAVEDEAEVSEPAAFEAEAVSDDAESEDDGYSSLLELNTASPPRQQFVRIEEPVDHSAEVEPVVIFPGQSARAAAQSAPLAAPPAEVTGLRRFDAPAGAVSGRPVAASGPVAPLQNAVETEQALRAALATLQRMSGAA